MQGIALNNRTLLQGSTLSTLLQGGVRPVQQKSTPGIKGKC